MNEDYRQTGNTIYIKTQKNNTDAFCQLTDEIRVYIETINKFVNPKSVTNDITYNRNLKEIAKIAGLNRMVEFKNPQGETIIKPLYEVISSHYARHTFITNECRKGTPKETIKKMVGHDDKSTMIDDIYKHFTTEDKINEFERLLNETDKTVKTQTQGDPSNELFAYDSLKAVKTLLENNQDGIHTQAAKTAIRVIKDISRISKYTEIDKAKALEINDTINRLGFVYGDIELVAMYNYKLKCFGVIDTMPTEDEIIDMFQQMTPTEQDYIDFQIKQWEEREGKQQ